MRKGIVAGVVLTLVGGAGMALLLVTMGWVPANADAKPSGLERWAATTALNAVVAREAPRGPNPLPATAANLEAGARVYADNCQVCHGGSDGEQSHLARGLYQRPPPLARAGVEDDPAGETYWKIRHGIRWTGMPSFGRSLSEREAWEVTLFLQNMDHLPTEVDAVWRGTARAGASAAAKAGAGEARAQGQRAR